ncbi:MAG: cation:proton antiporter [Minisyncoccia bacterium]
MNFLNLGIIFAIIFLISSFFYLINQPLLISYIISGTFVSNFFNLSESDISFLNSFADLGIIFLFFVVGLQLDFNLLKEISKKAVLIGLSQEVLTILAGVILIILLGYPFKQALLISTALSFSSTAIVLKILSDKKELETLYGRLIIGFMIVQDIFALFVFFLLDLIEPNFIKFNEIIISFLSLFLFFFLLFIANKIIKKFEEKIESNLEYLFVFSLSYLMGVISLGNLLNIGNEISSLSAGLSLANLAFSKEIVSRFKPLRDFFILLFFVKLGLNLPVFQIDFNFLYHLLILSFFVIFINPLIVMFIMWFFKFPLKVNFVVSLSSGQISEFSFVMADIAKDKKFFNENLIHLISGIGFATIFVSSYLLYFHETIFNKIKRFLRFFEVKEREEKEEIFSYQILLLGADRIGGIILRNLKDYKDKILIIDYNPEIVKKLKNENFNVIYGDVSEVDFLEELNLKNTKIVISTIPDLNVNLLLLDFLKSKNKEIIFISVASREKEKLELENKGSDFVFIPYHLGGEAISKKIRELI